MSYCKNTNILTSVLPQISNGTLAKVLVLKANT